MSGGFGGRPNPGPRNDGGQAAVEFALVLPLVVLVLLGLLQAVVLGVEATRVASAAREAARAAAIGRDDEGVREAALRGGAGLDPKRLDLHHPTLPATSGTPITVEVVYRTQLFVPALERLGVPAPVLRASATMLAE